jgi:signal transduction histidine kinase
MRLSLSSKIILSMTGMVFLTALSCSVVFLIIINNQTREFESRLEKAVAQNPAPPPASEILARLRTVLNNTELTADAQLSLARQTLRGQSFEADKIRQVAAESGWPIQDKKIIQRPEPGSQTVRIDEGTVVGFFSSPMYNAILISAGISAIMAFGLGFLLSRKVIRPLRKLEQASESIADGNYNLVLKPEGKDDLGRLASSFNKMSRALRQTEQKRKDLVADLSHELRTPLSSIQGYTEALRDNLIQDPRRREEVYDYVLNEVRHMTTMVNSVRQWVNNEQVLEQLKLEDVEVKPVIQTVIDRHARRAEDKGVKLVLVVDEPEPKVKADPEILTQIISNLVDNSLRYTPNGGEVQVEIKYLSRGKQVQFEVRDTGCGIPPEHLPFVFERFYRVDKSRNRTTGGTGLGLAIVRDAVQAQGGEIKLESDVAKGTSVIFLLPAAKTRAIERQLATV